MAQQLYTVSGYGAPRRRQVDELNARVALLPSILSQQSQKQYQTAQIANMDAQRKLDEARFGLEQSKYGLAEQELGLKKRETDIAQSAADFQQTRFGWEQSQAKKAQELQTLTQQREMGIKAAGLGVTALTNGWQNFKLGDIGSKVSGLWSGLFGNETKQQVGSGITGYGGEETPGISGGNTNTGVLNSLPVGAMAAGGLAGFAGGNLLGGSSKPTKSLLGAGIGAGVGYLTGGWEGALGGGLLGGLGGLF